MAVYIGIVILLLCLSLASKNIFSVILAFIALFMVQAFRDISVGTDTYNYQMVFDGYAGDYIKGFEYGWYFLSWLATNVFSSYQSLLILASLFTLVPIFISAKKISCNPLLIVLFYVLLYFYFHSFNIMRQGIAMSFGLLGIIYLRTDIRKFCICVVLGVLFHTSAFLLFLLPLVKRVYISPFFATFVLLGTFILGGGNLISSLLSLLGNFELYSGYTDVELSSEGSFSLTRFLLNLLLIFLLFVADARNLYLKIFFVGVVLLNILSSVPYIARMAQYFLIVQVLLYPTIYFVREKKYAPIFKMVLYIYAFIVFIFSLTSNIAEVVPYKFGI